MLQVMSQVDASESPERSPRRSARRSARRQPALHLTWKDAEVAGRHTVFGEAGEGPPVLFLHGWGLDHKVYKRALARLAAAGARVLAPAMPGFGGTQPLAIGCRSLAGYAAWAADFLDAVHVTEPVQVVGHSFGGGVAITFAHDHPDRVRSLVLINSIGASAWTKKGTALRSMAQRPLWDWGLHFPGDLWPLGQARRVVPVILSEALPNLLREPGAFVQAAELARRANLTAELQEIRRRRLPVVVLWGSRDRIITRAAFEQMCELLGQPPSHVVEGSHSWLIADPDAFAEVMTNVVDVAEEAGRLEGRGQPRELRFPFGNPGQAS